MKNFVCAVVSSGFMVFSASARADLEGGQTQKSTIVDDDLTDAKVNKLSEVLGKDAKGIIVKVKKENKDSMEGAEVKVTTKEFSKDSKEIADEFDVAKAIRVSKVGAESDTKKDGYFQYATRWYFGYQTDYYGRTYVVQYPVTTLNYVYTWEDYQYTYRYYQLSYVCDYYGCRYVYV